MRLYTECFSLPMLTVTSSDTYNIALGLSIGAWLLKGVRAGRKRKGGVYVYVNPHGRSLRVGELNN